MFKWGGGVTEGALIQPGFTLQMICGFDKQILYKVCKHPHRQDLTQIVM